MNHPIERRPVARAGSSTDGPPVFKFSPRQPLLAPLRATAYDSGVMADGAWRFLPGFHRVIFMDRTYIRAARDAEVGLIVDALQKQQFLRPHQMMSQAVSEAGQTARFCPQAADRALRWLDLNADKPIGRLRLSELLQLARSIQRFWRQAALRAERVGQPQS